MVSNASQIATGVSHQVHELKNSPIGKLAPLPGGAWAFIPEPLPKGLYLSSSLVFLLDTASRAVATLAGVGETLPNPHLLIQPFVRREAVLSSRIEGTQASIADVLMFEAGRGRAALGDVQEVFNYVRALELGLERLADLPICARLVNELHLRLLQGVRGTETRSGQLRDRQVWIGTEGTPIEAARFVPPPPQVVPDLLADWERFINEPLELPPLVRCALMHYQFEAIHPYLDGNGRIGRLLIVLFLCALEVLPVPLLYLSAFFERRRAEYYHHLFRVSATGEWEPWLRFFLEGVVSEAQDALERSRQVRALHDRYRKVLQERGESANALRFLEELFTNPFATAPHVQRLLGTSLAGSRRLLERLVAAGILAEQRPSWPRMFVARELLELIEAPVVTPK